MGIALPSPNLTCEKDRPTPRRLRQASNDMDVTMAGFWWRKAFQASAWLLAIAIAAMSLVPPTYRPVSEASQEVEHLLSFLTMGAAFGLGYSEKSSVLAAGLLVFCSAIELAQYWVPGRHARLSDF